MSDITLDAYIFFDGTCKEAMEFYKSIFGGELTMQLYDDVPGMASEATKGRVVHAMLSGGAIRLMASDGMEQKNFSGDKISLSLSGTDDAQLREFYEKLAEGGSADYPLEKAFWGDIFGSCTDKYGTCWMVNINAAMEATQ